MATPEVFMSDERKYRHRGYRDDDRERERKPAPPRAPREAPMGPRTPNLMASHEVFRCGRCGHLQSAAFAADARCAKCSVDLHSCVQCVSFDPGAPLECMQAIRIRVSPKDARNECALFTPRTTFERQTGSAPAAGPVSARQAFDDLFK
jgi:hypothetical protein